MNDLFYGKQRAITFDRGTSSFVYNSTSRNLKTIVSPMSDSLLYNYDGTLALSEEWRGEVNGKVEIKYDNSQRVIKETVNGVDSINITCDKDDNLMKVGAYAVKRNTLNGLVTSDTVGTIITDYTYNTAGELTGVNVKRSSASLYTVSYTRDTLGRISVKQETIEETTQRFNYFYDIAGRLNEVKRNDTSQAIYSYDANGNRLDRVTLATADSGSCITVKMWLQKSFKSLKCILAYPAIVLYI